MSTLIMWHNRFSENENEAVEIHIHDIRIPRPKSHDIEIPRPKNRDFEIQGLKDRDIEKRRIAAIGDADTIRKGIRNCRKMETVKKKTAYDNNNWKRETRTNRRRG